MLLVFFTAYSDKIKSIEIKGNIFFDDKKLLSLMRLKKNREFSRSDFREDRLKILNFYKSEGFLNVKITNYDYNAADDGIHIDISLDEDYRTVINEMKVFNNSLLTDEQILNLVKFHKNMPLNFNELALGRIRVIDRYSEMGFIYADVDYEILDKENRYRKIVYITVSEKHRAYIKEINFDSIPEEIRNICKQENNIRIGSVYTPQKIYKLQNEIISTGNFQALTFKAYGVEHQAESLIIYFNGSEKKSKWIAGGILYQFPDRGKLSAGWGHDNLFSNGEHLSFSTYMLMDVDLDNWFNALISYSVPYLFYSRLGYHIDSEFNREHTDFIQRYDFEIKTGLSRKIDDLVLTNDYRYKISIIDTNAATANVRIQNANTNSANIGIYYDIRNDPFYPMNGLKCLMQVEYAGGILQGYNNYTKLLFEFSYAKTIINRATTVFRAGTGIIAPFGVSIGRGISFDEQFTLGGYSTVRGFMQDSLGPLNEIGSRSGNMYINVNIEERMLVYKMFGIAYFFDSGLLYSSVKMPEFQDMAVSGGLGIFLKTIIGPVRFDISRPINRSGTLQYYLNLGNAF